LGGAQLGAPPGGPKSIKKKRAREIGFSTVCRWGRAVYDICLTREKFDRPLWGATVWQSFFFPGGRFFTTGAFFLPTKRGARMRRQPI